MTPDEAQENPFSAHLNPPQAAAVGHVDGPLLVFAGAGSGKTRVITFRIANLIATHRVPPYRILAVTFTNKAAGEMRTRLEGLLGPDIARDAWVGTFHATCAKLLRRHAEDVGLTRDFVIYDDSDQRAVIARVLKELNLDDRSYPPKQLLGRIMKEKQEGREPGEGARGSFTDEVLGNVYDGYKRHLTRANAVDFEDLIGHVMRLSEAPLLHAGQELRDRFDHVLVDEFQDTNHVQYRLVRALVTRHKNLCVVGDDDQSIYRWRGGDVRIIRNFKRDFPGALVVKLEENYRSSGRIVRAALGVIAPSEEREPKELFTRNPEGAKIALVHARDERDEAAYVVARVKQAAAEGIDASKLAVFYRIHAMSRVLEEAFRVENLPYRIVGGTRFFERAEVKDVLGYLRVLLNPRSDVDFLRIVNTPARGLGDGTIAKIAEIAVARQASLHDSLDASLESGTITGAAKKKLAAFRDMLAGLREAQARMSPSALAAQVLVDSGYRAMLQADDSAESDARLQNLEEFIGSIKEFEEEAEASGAAPSLASYLERVTLSTSADEQKGASQTSLMSIHSAKGLEFDTVFLVGMEEELFPYERHGDEHRTMDEEEERRLAYVAITRARRMLFLSHVGTRTLFGNTRYGRPSRFLRDLPPADLDQRSTPAASSSAATDRPAQRPSWQGGGSSYARGGAPSSRAGSAQPPRSTSYPSRPTPSPPAQPARPELAPGERYVERDPDSFSLDELARGARVKHPRFGEGTVQSVAPGGDPSAIVRFPGWGEKKILIRFLELA